MAYVQQYSSLTNSKSSTMSSMLHPYICTHGGRVGGRARVTGCVIERNEAIRIREKDNNVELVV